MSGKRFYAGSPANLHLEFPTLPALGQGRLQAERRRKLLTRIGFITSFAAGLTIGLFL